MSAGEIELKLTFRPEDGPRIKRMRNSLGADPGSFRVRTMVNEYYDTPDWELAALGIMVRIRSQGRACVQTVKTEGKRSAGLSRRQEWETPADRRRIDPQALTATRLPVFDDPDLAGRLVVRHSSHIKRSVCMLTGPDWRVEMCVDEGTLNAGEKSVPVHEVELELIEGHPCVLFPLARAIAARVWLGTTAQSKSERGTRLARNLRPAIVKAKVPPLHAKMGVTDAFVEISRSCLHHVLSNQEALLESEDPEAVHQMRVALRRLRSALKVFRHALPAPCPDGVRAEMKWLLAALGPARDADVFLDEIVAPVVASHPGDADILSVRHYWTAHRDLDFAHAVQSVAAPRFAAFLLEAGAWVESLSRETDDGQTILPFARKSLAKRHKALRKAGGTSLECLSSEQRHQVRILAKQMRYAGEFMAPLFPESKTRSFLEALAELQDHLGLLNDIAVAVPKLGAAHQHGRMAWAAGLVSGWHEARRPFLLAKAQQCWRGLRKHEPFW